MKIRLMNGNTVQVNDSYGARMIEQGHAVPVKEKTAKPAQKEKPVKKAEETKGDDA